MTSVLKSSAKDLLEAARFAIKEICRHCAENGNEPSMMRAFYEGVAYGQEREIVQDGWHYIELEGLQPMNEYNESEKCFVLTKHRVEDWCDTNMAYYDFDKKIWNLKDDFYQGNMRVIAWHLLPEIPNEL